MRLASYLLNGAPHYGAVVGTGVIELSRRIGRDFPDIKALIARDGLTAAQEAIAGQAADHALADLALLPPVNAPEKLWCIGVNYMDRNAEYIREAVLEDVRDELPHSLAVTIDDIVERDDKPITDIYANLFVERDSQKAIVIGKGGSRLRAIGETARRQIEPLVGGKVFLSIRVKVAKEWQRDPKQLGRLGF